MQVEKVVVGDLEENCYIVSINDKCLIIDPGDESHRIIDSIGNKEVLGILLTHHHFDHIGAVEDIKNKYNVSVYDSNNLKEGNINIGPFSFIVIFNPGHTPDSISFYFKDEGKMFVGDFVFLGSIGRCDLEGGNVSEMQKSLENLKSLNDNIILYPGHGLKTTLSYEKENNPFF